MWRRCILQTTRNTNSIRRTGSCIIRQASKKSKAKPTADKGEALKNAVSQIEASFGKGSIMQLGQTSIRQNVDVISTGSISLDLALGIGGLPRGRVVEVYGPESSGKTTVALQCIAQSQKTGGTCAFIDAEHAIDPSYAKALGVNVDDLYISQPDSGEQALEITDTLVRSGSMDVIVVDSVAALVPRAELEGEMGDSHIALQARLMSQALRKLTASLSKSNTLLIFINQIRQKVGIVFGNPEVTSGGTALRYYSSVRLDIRRKAQLKEGDEIVGNVIAVKVAKNKLAPPFRVANFDMIFGKGIDTLSELLELGCEVGVVKRSGSWYTYYSGEGEEGVPMGQGRSKARAYLVEHPSVAQDINNRIRKAKTEEDNTDSEEDEILED